MMKKLPGKQLPCVLSGSHVGCYCSCIGDKNCCGCGQLKLSASYYLHCLVCDTNFSSKINKGGTFDKRKFSQEAPLDELRDKSWAKIKRNNGTKKASAKDKNSFAYKSPSGDGSSGAAY